MIMSTKEICKRGLSMTISLTLGNTGFPLGDGFVAYIQPLRQIALGQSPLLAQAADDFPGYIALHAIPPCPRAYHARRKDATYAS